MAEDALPRERVTATFSRMSAGVELAWRSAGDRGSTAILARRWLPPVRSWSPVDLVPPTIPDRPTVA